MRGDIYLSLMDNMKGKYEIVSICDLNEERLLIYKEKFNIKDSNVFSSDSEFFKQKRSDVLLICTQDKDHIGNLLDALKAGYKQIVCEKPFATTFKDIKKAEVATRKANAQVLICHVLRYAPAYLRAKQYIDDGKIGVLKSIDASEKVGLIHQVHSYVRGHYKDSDKSSPMIMAKCCHDLDLLVWYSNSLCKSLSSIGSLSYFTKNNQPVGASHRCYNCKYAKECHYNAELVYKKYFSFMRPYITDARPVTDDAVKKSLETSDFGVCVFDSNNNVVDNQIVLMKFDNGIEASLKMTAFSPFGGRIYWFYGTKGEIRLDEQEGTFMYRDLEGNTEVVPISTLIQATEGHGGGDNGLINEIYDAFAGNADKVSSLEFSIESHKMALLAEKSRLKNGKKFTVHR